MFFRRELPWTLTPVVPIQPFTTINSTLSSTTTGTVAAYTTPTDKDFYVTGIDISMIKDAACDAASGGVVTVSTTVKGITFSLARISGITLTAQSASKYCSFPFPIKVDRGVAINVTGTFTAGVLVRDIVVHGYTDNTLGNR